jgi:3-hydroxyisobutyrate dehydrogenase-like beta-hydroxyacid dehydrogenase
MGGGLAVNLAQKGRPVRFFARSENDARIARLTRAGAVRAETLAALGATSDLVILCLPDSPAVESVLAERAGLIGGLAPGAIIVDCSTSHPDSTRRLAAALATRQLTLLDGPLTGSRTQADAGTLSVLGAGDPAAFDRVRPILGDFARHVFHLGASGAGHAAKLINNFLGQLALSGLCEAWGLLEAYGIDLDAFQAAISVSGGNSATFQAAYPALRTRDFPVSFAQKLAAKDVRYFTEMTDRLHLPSPLAAALLEVHRATTAAGFGEQDVKALLFAYERRRPRPANDRDAPARP